MALTGDKKDAFARLMKDVRYDARFIAFSVSRHRHEKTRDINWCITLARGPHEFQFDYSMGVLCITTREQEALRHIHGPNAFNMAAVIHDLTERATFGMGRKISPPLLDDVMNCLCSDADVLNYASFEDWAQNFGWDTDSRKAEKCYRECLDNTLKLMAMFGDSLTELKQLFADY